MRVNRAGHVYFQSRQREGAREGTRLSPYGWTKSTLCTVSWFAFGPSILVISQTYGQTEQWQRRCGQLLAWVEVRKNNQTLLIETEDLLFLLLFCDLREGEKSLRKSHRGIKKCIQPLAIYCVPGTRLNNLRVISFYIIEIFLDLKGM